jgi:hypothetical protein
MTVNMEGGSRFTVLRKYIVLQDNGITRDSYGPQNTCVRQSLLHRGLNKYSLE